MSDSDSDSVSSVLSHSYENLFIDDDDYDLQYRIWTRTAALFGVYRSMDEYEDLDEFSDVDQDEDYDLLLFKPSDETSATEKSISPEALFSLSNRTSKILSVWKKRLNEIKNENQVEVEDKCRKWDKIFAEHQKLLTQPYQLFRYQRGMFYAWTVRRVLTELGGEENCQKYQKKIHKLLFELKVLMVKKVLSSCLPPLPDLILERISTYCIDDEEASTRLCAHLSYNEEERILLQKLFQVLCDIYNEWKTVLYDLTDGMYLTGIPSVAKVDSLGEVLASFKMNVLYLADESNI